MCMFHTDDSLLAAFAVSFSPESALSTPAGISGPFLAASSPNPPSASSPKDCISSRRMRSASEPSLRREGFTGRGARRSTASSYAVTDEPATAAHARKSSRTRISVRPKRLRPFHSFGSPLRESSISIPMPQTRSLGAHSANSALPVASRSHNRRGFCWNLARIPRRKICTRIAFHSESL